MQPAHSALHPNRKAVTCTAAARRALVVITCSHRLSQHTGINQLLARCTSNVQQLWTAAAALQQQHLHNSKQHNWHQSLGIGAGVSAAALTASGGGYGPPGSSSWGSGGGGSGWGPSHGSSSGAGSNVLADVAATGDVADAAVEEVILLDIGGMKCGGCVGHVKQLLEQHPSVSAATVNLATETALVRVKMEPGADLSTLAAELAKALTAAGFPAAVSKKKITAAVTAQ